MNHELIAVLPRFVWYIIIGIAVLSILAYFLQEKLIFKPEKLKQDFEFKYDVPLKNTSSILSPVSVSMVFTFTGKTPKD